MVTNNSILKGNVYFGSQLHLVISTSRVVLSSAGFGA